MNRVGNKYQIRAGTRHHWDGLVLKAGDVIEVMSDLGFTVVVRAVGRDERWQWVDDWSLNTLDQLPKESPVVV